MGEPVSQYHDAKGAAAHCDYYAETWPHIQGISNLNTPGHVSMTLRQPFGIVAVFIPWNAPVLFLASKSAPALIAGNTVVLKSSEKAPLASARVAELVREAGFPRGVFNIVSGHGTPCGEVLASHMDVRVLSFTGSGRTGWLIQAAAARSNLKKVVLELGGKSPALVFDDADVEKAAADTSFSVQCNSGQICVANSRVYVQEAVATEFIEAFRKRFATIKAGDPLKSETNHGPQADEIQYNSVIDYIELGKKAGGSLVMGGQGHLESMKGYFVDPTVFLNSPEDSRLMREEVFGPVVNISTFKTEEEAIGVANDSDSGLYASVYTKDLNRAMRLTKALESGYVGVNCTSPTIAREMPFG